MTKAKGYILPFFIPHLGCPEKCIFCNQNAISGKQKQPTAEEISEKMDMADVVKLFMGQMNMSDYVEETVEEFEMVMGQQHIDVLNNFANHIVKGEALLAPGAEGINGVRLANAMHLSDWLDKEVDYNHDHNLYLEELNKRITEEGKFSTKA